MFDFYAFYCFKVVTAIRPLYHKFILANNTNLHFWMSLNVHYIVIQLD